MFQVVQAAAHLGQALQARVEPQPHFVESPFPGLLPCYLALTDHGVALVHEIRVTASDLHPTAHLVGVLLRQSGDRECPDPEIFVPDDPNRYPLRRR